MEVPMRGVLVTAGLLAWVSPAAASGGLWCEAKEAAAAIELQAGVSRGMGGAVFTFDGSVRIDDPRIADDMRFIAFTQEHLAQYWLDGEDLRLLLYGEREKGEHGYIELTIRTVKADELEYRGDFQITVFDLSAPEDRQTTKFAGPILCSAE
jgi:hypothetical protein